MKHLSFGKEDSIMELTSLIYSKVYGSLKKYQDEFSNEFFGPDPPEDEESPLETTLCHRIFNTYADGVAI